jgi:hypothetical protein
MLAVWVSVVGHSGIFFLFIKHGGINQVHLDLLDECLYFFFPKQLGGAKGATVTHTNVPMHFTNLLNERNDIGWVLKLPQLRLGVRPND